MKKRMLLSTVLMTLVLLLAVTTATFAWYSASTVGGVQADTTTASLGTVTDSYELAGVTVKVAYKSGDAAFTSGNVALTDNDGKVWAYNAQKHLVEATTQAPKGIVVTITLSLDEAAPQVVGKYTVTLVKSGTNANRLKTIEANSLPGVGAGLWADDVISWELEIDANGNIVSGATKTIVLAFDGTDAGFDAKDVAALSASLGVAIN